MPQIFPTVLARFSGTSMPSPAQLETPWLPGRPVPVVNNLPMVPVHFAISHEGSYEVDNLECNHIASH